MLEKEDRKRITEKKGKITLDEWRRAGVPTRGDCNNAGTYQTSRRSGATRGNSKHVGMVLISGQLEEFYGER